MSSTRIPLYRVKGTHYECAHSIGKLTQEAISQRISDDSAYLSPLFSFIQTEFGQKLHEGFISATRSLYPWYWDEMVGIADGSGIPLEQILVLNFLNETRTAFRLQEEERQSSGKSKQIENETGEKGCTTVLLNRKDTNIFSILHNEDHSATLFTTACLVQADIQSSKYDQNQRESPNEKFIAYCYAGVIPGTAFGVNVHGFACSLNGLYPNFVAHGRLPRQIVNRALLSIKNEESLDRLLESSPVAYGFCINGGFFAEKNYLFNYEIGPNLKVDNENLISKCLIVNDKENVEKNCKNPTKLNYLIHYNHYERLDKVIVQQKALQSSYNRWERGQEFGEIKTIEDAFRLLGDSKNEEFPIFRTLNQTKSTSVTLCTIHINFLTMELSIYENNPKENNQPTMIYNLSDLLIPKE